MKLKEQVNYRTIVAYLYDPIPLDKVGLDELKKIFPNMQVDANFQFIFGESSEPKFRLQLLTARLDFVHEGEKSFPEHCDRVLRTLLSAAPPIIIRGLGVTIFKRVLIDDAEQDAGVFAGKYFLSDFDARQKAIGAKIIASMHRITYGEQNSYFDFRISPQQIGGDRVQLQLRKHKDVDLRDSDRIIRETLDAETAVKAEFERIIPVI